MVARQCDACKKFYEKPMFYPIIQIKMDRGIQKPRYFDLCDECQKKLEDFVHYIKEKK